MTVLHSDINMAGARCPGERELTLVSLDPFSQTAIIQIGRLQMSRPLTGNRSLMFGNTLDLDVYKYTFGHVTEVSAFHKT